MTSYTFKALTPLARGVSMVVCVLLGCNLAGCAASSTPELDKTFGDTVRKIYAQQTIVAPPAQLQDPVMGMDGVAAAHTQQRYQDSFKEPAKTFDMLSSGGGK
jgi:hypothetical protein